MGKQARGWVIPTYSHPSEAGAGDLMNILERAEGGGVVGTRSQTHPAARTTSSVFWTKPTAATTPLHDGIQGIGTLFTFKRLRRLLLRVRDCRLQSGLLVRLGLVNCYDL